MKYIGPCLCGDPACPSCGMLQGTIDYEDDIVPEEEDDEFATLRNSTCPHCHVDPCRCDEEYERRRADQWDEYDDDLFND